jgi:hypothetical protein
MKMWIIAAILAVVLSTGAVGSLGATTDEPATTSACPALGMAQEMGLLVLGIGWEAVRIVLPDSCPAKHKDIDALLRGSEGTK